MRKKRCDIDARDNRHSRAKSIRGSKSLNEAHLEQILAPIDDPFLLVLDCVQDPHNLGALLRTADGAGVNVVIAPKDKSVGITETVERIAVGAAASVPFVRVTNLARTLKLLQRERGIWFVGTSDAANQSIYQTDLKGPLGIVMGAEGEGIRRLTEEICDFLVTIPMAGKVECLNVSVAAGVCLYEAVRQRDIIGR